MSDANLYFIVVQLLLGLARPKYDRQPILPNAYGMFLSFLELYLFTTTQILFLCYRSFEHFLKAFSTIGLAIICAGVP